eukprot:TRINITY_DN37493_c0_g1_i1.p1 TRINITY_DN37493_c0_g1~~TRINITY_DN37493_c0_g1_i1.p1  ORF type:complete len:293 (+),score=99.64 TRINITY_DN37493_c0_g1_i1:122-880(+)
MQVRLPADATVADLRRALRAHPTFSRVWAHPIRLADGPPIGWSPPTQQEFDCGVPAGSVSGGPFSFRVPGALPDPAGSAPGATGDCETQYLPAGSLFTVLLRNTHRHCGCRAVLRCDGREVADVRLGPSSSVAVERAGDGSGSAFDVSRLYFVGEGTGTVISADFTPDRWWDTLGAPDDAVLLADAGVTRDSTLYISGTVAADAEPVLCAAGAVTLRLRLAISHPPAAERSRLRLLRSPHAFAGEAQEWHAR